MVTLKILGFIPWILLNFCLIVEEKMIDPAAARSEPAYITILNSAGRAVKVIA